MMPGPGRLVALAGAAALALACGVGSATDDAAADPPAGLDVPEGMVYVPGGRTHVGSDEGMPDERPVREVEIAPFLLDAHPVTVAAFAAFVDATGHETDAERFGDAGVYDPATGGWTLVRGATWRRPLGPDGPEAAPDHPVTQVSWHDAVAYAEWAGKRLPTEAEWEHAARDAADDRAAYAWGDSLTLSDRHHANTWQGALPGGNTGEDGFLLTSPVGAFGATPLGLTDMGGNVWEWTADWYAPYGTPPRATGERAQRGGSFLCEPTFCSGYRVSARSHASPETSLFHVGFRLAKDLPET